MTALNIVIVNWNTGKLLAECIRSIIALPATEKNRLATVYIIDNASHDNSMQQASLAMHEPQGVRFNIISNTANMGFAAANNIVLRELIKSHSQDHVLLLNPDTRLLPGAISALLEVIEQKDDVGIVGCKLLNPDESLQRSVRPFPSFTDFIFYMLKLGRVVQVRQEKKFNYEQAGYVDQVMGAAFLIRNKTLQAVGLLDQEFFTLFEEVDYCQRARRIGYKTFYTPSGSIIHVRGASFAQLLGWHRSWPWLMSALHYAEKYFLPWQVLFLKILLPLAILLTIPATLKHIWQRSLNKKILL